MIAATDNRPRALDPSTRSPDARPASARRGTPRRARLGRTFPAAPERKETPMARTEIHRRIKYESELDAGFGEKIARAAYGEKLFSCIQCGTCSATCPVSHYMDYTPRRIIAMVREGFRDEVLNSVTIW